ncbi:DUF11 domain-containing protein [Candidatus Mycosynbacter amalyticus]|uniref:DUF11 domain-containing protein n=1 Tax=Candidatus Mycosynbacter amalyticus TaxID=2665156 RepID=A0A857MLW3_9BACT|nr:DUF11 domain-containing protein [Candidatus Mycosynbacter amalyticus]QHN43098.1 DUF11 domain-containing protein [Candidatus Mycosynbacter amalyticus]
MKKLFAALRSAPKRVATLAIVAAAIAVPASLYAWGPDRPTYTMQDPADHVTFNSITDNAKYGDERNFVQIREAGTGTYGENINIQPGKEYEVFVYYHNNAATRLNSAENGYKGIAQNAKMRIQMPASVAAGQKARVTGVLSADNAQPQQVWDEAYGTSTSNDTMYLRYTQGSATIHNLGTTNGATMPDSLFGEGAPLGYNSLDGKLPGCNEYAGYVTFRFKAVQPNFEVSKQVSKAGANSYSENVTVNPGDSVNYKIQYKNTGTVKQDNVVINDVLPKGVTYVPGTTYYATGNSNGQWVKSTSDNVTKGGINIGTFSPGANAYVAFTAKVASNDELEKCGTNVLTNKAQAITENGTKEDTADVTTNKECKPQPEYKCTALAVSTLSDTKFKFETGYSVSGGTFKSVSYTVRNEAGATVATVAGTPNAAEYTQTTPGKYTVQATVTFTVNGQDVTATGDACKKAFEVPTPPQPGEIKVCDLSTKQIVTIKEDEFDSSKYSKNLEDCAETQIIVCDMTTKTIVTIKENELDSNKYTKDTSMCQVTPVTPTTPATPAELPMTGSTDGPLTIAGLATLALVLGYAVTARRTLG